MFGELDRFLDDLNANTRELEAHSGRLRSEMAQMWSVTTYGAPAEPKPLEALKCPACAAPVQRAGGSCRYCGVGLR